MKIIIVLCMFILLVVIIGAVAGSGGKSKTPAQQTAAAADAQAKQATHVAEHKYPPELITKFVADCVADGGPQSYCQCIIGEVQKDFAWSDYRDPYARAAPLGAVAMYYGLEMNVCLTKN